MLVATSAHAYFTGGKYDSPEERASVQAAERALDHRNFDEAMELSRKSCEDFPDSLTAVRVFIAAAYSTGHLSEALEKFTPAQDAGMPGVKAHYARAWAATLAGDPAGGRSEIVRAIALSKKEQFELQRVFLVTAHGPEGKTRALMASTSNSSRNTITSASRISPTSASSIS